MAKETKKPNEQGAVTTHNWASETTTGFEGTQQTDLGIPFLAILQALSPQVNKADRNYPNKGIKDAQAGDIINNLANAVIYRQGGDPLEFIPCYHERLFVEWTPRNQGGGMVKAHKSPAIINECTRDENGRDVLKNGNIVVTTSYFYGIAIVDGQRLPCCIGMSSTQIKKARAWLNTAMGIKLEGPTGKFTPPLFSHVYLLSTIPESNNDGNWFGWKVDIKGMLNDQELIGIAKKTAQDSAAAQRTALPPASKDEADHVM